MGFFGEKLCDNVSIGSIMVIMDKNELKKTYVRKLLELYEGNEEEIIRDVKSLGSLRGIGNTDRYIPSEDESPLITVKRLSRTYKSGRNKVEAVKSVSFDIYEKEIVALTGTSGSGKSTLLHLLGGLDKPTEGEIVIDGVNIGKLSDRKLSIFRNQKVGFVFQFFYLQPFLTVAQNIAVPSMVAKMAIKERKERIEELAGAVGLSERLRHLPKELSGGQMQRAAIARALFNRPKILIADEPTGNLDSANSATILRLFKKVREEYGTTIIIVTHDENIANLADRKIMMRDGELL